MEESAVESREHVRASRPREGYRALRYREYSLSEHIARHSRRRTYHGSRLPTSSHYYFGVRLIRTSGSLALPHRPHNLRCGPRILTLAAEASFPSPLANRTHRTVRAGAPSHAVLVSLMATTRIRVRLGRDDWQVQDIVIVDLEG